MRARIRARIRSLRSPSTVLGGHAQSRFACASPSRTTLRARRRLATVSGQAGDPGSLMQPQVAQRLDISSTKTRLAEIRQAEGHLICDNGARLLCRVMERVVNAPIQVLWIGHASMTLGYPLRQCRASRWSKPAGVFLRRVGASSRALSTGRMRAAWRFWPDTRVASCTVNTLGPSSRLARSRANGSQHCSRMALRNYRSHPRSQNSFKPRTVRLGKVRSATRSRSFWAKRDRLALRASCSRSGSHQDRSCALSAAGRASRPTDGVNVSRRNRSNSRCFALFSAADPRRSPVA
jgi:hypothetical protein